MRPVLHVSKSNNVMDSELYISYNLKRSKSCAFEAMHLNEYSQFATTIKNIMLEVFSEFVLKVGDSGQM